MASETALLPTPQSAPVQNDSQSIRFLDLPLEVRIMIYTEITSRPESHYMNSPGHSSKALPTIFCTHPQITREIYQFCTITTRIAHKIFWKPSSIFTFLSFQLLENAAQKTINFNAQTNHKGAVLNIIVSCDQTGCFEEDCCEVCRSLGEKAYILRIEAMGLERRLVNLL